jgi:hypothetical protein
MSIFSRLLKRSPEDGGGAPADAASPAAKEKERDEPQQQAQAKDPKEQTNQQERKEPKEQSKEQQQQQQQQQQQKDAKARPTNGVAQAPPPTPPGAAEAKSDAKTDGKAAAKVEPKPDPKAPAVNGSAGKTLAYMAVSKPAPVPAPGMVPPPPGGAKAGPRPGNGVRIHEGARDPRETSQHGTARDPRETSQHGAARDPRETSQHGAARRGDGAQPMEMMPVLAAATVEQAIEKALSSRGAAAPAAHANGEGNTTASDRAAMMATFEDLAVPHTAQVRSLMIEVRWGEAQASWIDLSRPALRSLRSMANQIGSAQLTAALDGFDAALEKALAPGAPTTLVGPVRDALLAAYAPLTACLPRAFDLDGERDRREPLVVRALLGQVHELDPLMIDRMMAAGLGRLQELVRARADEIAVVAGVSLEIAEAAAARVQAFRKATQAALATLDPAETARELGTLFHAFSAEHRAFEDAAAGWSDGNPARKRQLRRQRDVSFLQITIALARLGEIDLALRLEKLPFSRRIEELERFLGRFPPAALAPAAEREAEKKVEGRLEGGLQPGAHAAP